MKIFTHKALTLSIIFLAFFNVLVLNIPTTSAEVNLSGNLTSVETTFTNDTSDLSGFKIKNDNEFYFVNSSQDKVVIFNNDTVEEFGSTGVGNGQFGNPTLISILPNENIFTYDSGLERLQQFDNSYNFLSSYNFITTSSDFVSLGQVNSLTNDLAGNLYLLDYTNNMIVKKAPDENELVEYINGAGFGLTFTSNTKIWVTANGEKLFIANTDSLTNLYELNSLKSLSPILIETYNITNVNEIKTDCANNLFILDKNATESKIHKLTKNSYIHEAALSVSFNGLNDAKSFDINIETGQIFINNSFTNTLQTLTPDNYQGIFTENISSFINPIDYTEEIALTSPVKIAEVNNNNSPILATPYNINSTITIDQDDLVIILSETVDNNPDYYYVLYINHNSGVNISGYMLNTNLTILEGLSEQFEDHKALNNNTPVYKYPTSLNAVDEAVIVDYLDKEEVVKVNGDAYSITDYNGHRFYLIPISETEIGYVKQQDMLAVSVIATTPTLVTNAEIFIQDDSEFVAAYTIVGNNSSMIPYELIDGQNIYVSTYDSEQEWTRVSFVNNNNEVLNAYIQTKYVKIHNQYDNLLQALGLSLVSFILIVILALIKFGSKKEKEL